MTDHDSEKLYDELRRRLEGYGSAPPESVWAGIRQQVPARRPRWRPRALLLLVGTVVLVCLTVGTRRWREQAERPGARAGASRTFSAAPTGSGSGLAYPSSPPPATASAPEISLAPAKPADVRAASPVSPQVSTKAAAPAAPPAAAEQVPGGTSATLPTAAIPAIAPTLPSGGSPSDDQLRAPAAEALLPERHPGKRVAAARRPRRFRDTSTAGTGLLASAPGLKAPRAAQLAAARKSRLLAESPATRQRSRAIRAESSLPADRRPYASAPQTAGRAWGQQEAFSNYEPLALLVVRPPQAAPAPPEVQPINPPTSRPTRQELNLRNWSVQAGAGAGLTYRLLGQPRTALERLERPALGLTGQLLAAYAFSRQLTVAAGLGYAEYATSLRYQLKKDSVETLERREFRNVYRFFTLPVQAQLTLRSTHRWRYGLLGGGTVAVFAGARTTEGSPCNCSQRQWSSGSGPFRTTSLLLTAGAFAGYQVAPGRWLTLQPQGQLFLTSLTDPATARAPRRPWGLGIQAGYSWDLAPRGR
ncbi:hypothetical protein [Hymenobacter weizhouensis]|uniref:hypothetical protein n=1 Tax=Hymenobacter sp. YIM 151500-1 TaxID=2987689 RepID=UPI002225C65A|nr:hypothetical protein [Hymenobacter sp. YIM 151500-1]UYZ64676.1 hypothetical protein OIS53_07460 [Hymenobacter sp. YIM 151500-1]